MDLDLYEIYGLLTFVVILFFWLIPFFTVHCEDRSFFEIFCTQKTLS